MSIREIITPDNEILRQTAQPVSAFDDPQLQVLIDDMVETMLDAPGVGLAAPQVAVSQRVIVVRLSDDEESQKEYGDEAGKLYVMLNPEITQASRLMVEGIEACLSLPGYFGSVDRHETITVKGFDRHGKPAQVKVKGWLARVFQHEIDHLDGILYIDRANEVWEAGEDEEETEES